MVMMSRGPWNFLTDLKLDKLRIKVECCEYYLILDIFACFSFKNNALDLEENFSFFDCHKNKIKISTSLITDL